MMRAIRSSLILVPALASVSAGQGPATRQLTTAAAVSAESFTTIPNVRALPGGMLLVNDVARRRLVLLDSNLALVRVVADSTATTSNAYGTRPGGLIPYRGDSTLFVDPAGLSMLVIDPAGKIARVASVPRSQDAQAMAASGGSLPGFDGKGLVYRSTMRMAGGPMMTRDVGGGGATMGAPTPPAIADSAPIQRVDIATRKVDTVAWVRVPRASMAMTQSGNSTVMTSRINPLPVTDEWTVTPDGSIAIVRGQDYRIDWIAADGTPRSFPKIPFNWERLSDEAKQALVDSTQKAIAARDATPGAADAPGPVITRTTGSGGGDVTTRMTVGGGGGGTVFFGGPAGAGGMAGMAMPLEVIPAAELPDYRPPFLAGGVRADPANRLWVRTTAAGQAGGGAVHDVIDPAGKLVDRVQFAPGRTVVGFGEGGVVYLLARTDFGSRLERVVMK